MERTDHHRGGRPTDVTHTNKKNSYLGHLCDTRYGTLLRSSAARRQDPRKAHSRQARFCRHRHTGQELEPVEILIGLEDRQQVRAAMNLLNGQDREILFLKHAENWTYDQICKHTGITRDKVIYRIRRARSRLKTGLSSVNLKSEHKHES